LIAFTYKLIETTAKQLEEKEKCEIYFKEKGESI